MVSNIVKGYMAKADKMQAHLAEKRECHATTTLVWTGEQECW
jgi:hypothetical protein